MSTGWQIVIFVHLVAMAFFLGGQLLIAISVPVLRTDREVLRAVARRFGWGSLVALIALGATGAALAAHERRWGSSTLQLKIGLAALLAALVLTHLRFSRAPALQGAIFVVTLAVVWLGVRLAD